jgi:hypothetical protein
MQWGNEVELKITGEQTELDTGAELGAPRLLELLERPVVLSVPVPLHKSIQQETMEEGTVELF